MHLLVNKKTKQFFKSATLKLIEGDYTDISLIVLRQRVACRAASVVVELFEIWISG
jgi:hypothetical protein